MLSEFLALTFYPVNDFGPLMKGLVIGGLGIFHVFVAHFAIGGGMLMVYFQWLAQSGREPRARMLLDSYFRVLILLSFVMGAVTGVALWFTSIQVSAPTIGAMVYEFHWVWATEWAFFVVEVVAGYTFFRYAPRLSDKTRMTLLLAYTIAGWGSLFWINGILSWQLTPGDWVETGNVWAGFFNPSFWPSLAYRTVASMTIAGLVGALVVNTMRGLDSAGKRALINRCAHFLLPMTFMPFLGWWFLWTLPPDSRSWVLGGSATMTLFLGIALGASALIGVYAFLAMWMERRPISGATATLLIAVAFAASAGGEFVREGVRKPYTIRQALYSNAIRPDEVARLRKEGSVTNDPYPLRDAELYTNDQLRLGARVFRMQCAICHTIDGVNGLAHLAGPWTYSQMRQNIAKLQHLKNFMPPFAGNARELEALVQLIAWETRRRPDDWPETDDPLILEQIDRWLEEAGTEPGVSPRLASAGKNTEGGAR